MSEPACGFAAHIETPSRAFEQAVSFQDLKDITSYNQDEACKTHALLLALNVGFNAKSDKIYDFLNEASPSDLRTIAEHAGTHDMERLESLAQNILG